MKTWQLLLVGFGGISVLCTLLIYGACIVSDRATRARERDRTTPTYVEKDLLARFERMRSLWRRT